MPGRRRAPPRLDHQPGAQNAARQLDSPGRQPPHARMDHANSLARRLRPQPRIEGGALDGVLPVRRRVRIAPRRRPRHGRPDPRRVEPPPRHRHHLQDARRQPFQARHRRVAVDQGHSGARPREEDRRGRSGRTSADDGDVMDDHRAPSEARLIAPDGCARDSLA
jgi:hypothetical protein